MHLQLLVLNIGEGIGKVIIAILREHISRPRAIARLAIQMPMKEAKDKRWNRKMHLQVIHAILNSFTRIATKKVLRYRL